MYGYFVGKSPLYPQKSPTNPLYGPGGVYTLDTGLFCRNIGPYIYRTLCFRNRALFLQKIPIFLQKSHVSIIECLG